MSTGVEAGITGIGGTLVGVVARRRSTGVTDARVTDLDTITKVRIETADDVAIVDNVGASQVGLADSLHARDVGTIRCSGTNGTVLDGRIGTTANGETSSGGTRSRRSTCNVRAAVGWASTRDTSSIDSTIVTIIARSAIVIDRVATCNRVALAGQTRIGVGTVERRKAFADAADTSVGRSTHGTIVTRSIVGLFGVAASTSKGITRAGVVALVQRIASHVVSTGTHARKTDVGLRTGIAVVTRSIVGFRSGRTQSSGRVTLHILMTLIFGQTSDGTGRQVVGDSSRPATNARFVVSTDASLTFAMETQVSAGTRSVVGHIVGFASTRYTSIRVDTKTVARRTDDRSTGTPTHTVTLVVLCAGVQVVASSGVVVVGCTGKSTDIFRTSVRDTGVVVGSTTSVRI